MTSLLQNVLEVLLYTLSWFDRDRIMFTADFNVFVICRLITILWFMPIFCPWYAPLDNLTVRRLTQNGTTYTGVPLDIQYNGSTHQILNTAVML